MSHKIAGRTYWQMYEGLFPEGWDHQVTFLALDLDVGGWAARFCTGQARLSVYGRAYLTGRNLVTLYRRDIALTSGTWKRYKMRKPVVTNNVRCIVARVETTTNADPNHTAPERNDDDQYDTSSPPAWGVRIVTARVYGSPLVRDIYPHKILDHICDSGGFASTWPTTDNWKPNQMAFTEVPHDRWEAIDEVNDCLGWNYACWDGANIAFSAPKSGTAWEVAADDPRTTWNVSESLDECYNCVRVCYANKKGKKRELIVRVSDSDLTIDRADCITAPEAIKDIEGARRYGTRYLNDHKKRQVGGTVNIAGDDGILDAMLIRPGDTITMTGPARFLSGTHEVTNVTLHPLDWSADVTFGNNPKRFDRWLARMAVGAKTIKRR